MKTSPVAVVPLEIGLYPDGHYLSDAVRVAGCEVSTLAQFMLTLPHFPVYPAREWRRVVLVRPRDSALCESERYDHMFSHLLARSEKTLCEPEIGGLLCRSLLRGLPAVPEWKRIVIAMRDMYAIHRDPHDFSTTHANQIFIIEREGARVRLDALSWGNLVLAKPCISPDDLIAFAEKRR